MSKTFWIARTVSDLGAQHTKRCGQFGNKRWRSRGRSIPSAIAQLRTYLTGWKNYFKLADKPRVFREADEWVRHRLRALQLKHWKNESTVYRELLARGLSPEKADKVARNTNSNLPRPA